MNQVAVVNVNAAAPVGNGRSLVVDAEGAVRYEAGVAEEVLTAVLDLDAVARVRERGAFGHQPAVGGDGPRRAGARAADVRRALPAAAAVELEHASRGSAGTVRPSRPLVSTAAQSESSTASSVASTVAWKSPSSSPVRATSARPTVANATKISPLPWWATEPARASPSPTRRARRSRCCGDERRVGRDDPDAAAGGLLRSIGRHERRPTGTPSTRSCSARAEVREQQHADRVLAGAAARRADAALPAEAAHARTGADRAALEVGARRRDRLRDVGRLHVRDARIGEPAVVALADDGDHHVVDSDARIGRHRDLDGARRTRGRPHAST